MKTPETGQYEYFNDSDESRPFRYNGNEDRFEEKVGDEWIPIKRGKVAAGKNPSTDLITNVAFTSYQDWNAEPETSTEVPKTLADQVASTKVGRAMQSHAEDVCNQTDEITERDFEMAVSPERRKIALCFESGQLGVERNGSIAINPETDKNSLKAVREALLDPKLDAKDRETMRDLIGKVDKVITLREKTAAEAIAHREIAEAPHNVIKALEELKDLQAHVKIAIEKREFEALPHLNEKLLRIAFMILDGFEKMRASDPDTMIGLVERLQSDANLDYPYKTALNPCKTALIEFVRTHNSFRFSEEAIGRLEYAAKRDAQFEQKRGGKPTFRQVLVDAYNAPKKEDDPYTFLQKITRIPENRFRAIVEKALNS